MDANAITKIVELGSAGAVIIVVIYFLKFIRERDKQWQAFFSSLHTEDTNCMNDMKDIVLELRRMILTFTTKFDSHDAQAKEILTKVEDLRNGKIKEEVMAFAKNK